VNGRRLKLGAILAGLVLSGLTLLAWTQQWFSIELIPDGSVAVGGDVAAPALAALALSGLALVAALAIAGPVFRVILGLLEAAIGTLVVVSAILAIVDPVAASASAITAVTGVSGTASVIALVSTVAPTAWPFVALLAGALVVAVGITIVVSGRFWPQSSRKYQTARLAEVDGSPIGDWDALSDGRDPT